MKATFLVYDAPGPTPPAIIVLYVRRNVCDGLSMNAARLRSSCAFLVCLSGANFVGEIKQRSGKAGDSYRKKGVYVSLDIRSLVLPAE